MLKISAFVEFLTKLLITLLKKWSKVVKIVAKTFFYLYNRIINLKGGVDYAHWNL